MEAKSKQSGHIFKGKLAEVFVRIGIAEPIEEVELIEENTIKEAEKPIENVNPINADKPKRTYNKRK